MVVLVYLIILLLVFILLPILVIIYAHQKQGTVIPINWPILGMIPGLLLNIHRPLDYITEVLIESHGTFMFKAPRFANMNKLFITDPLDIHHILSKNFTNYPKGDEFHKIFDILGDGILSADGKIWEITRKAIFTILKHAEFQAMMETIIWDKLENGLLPMLESICECGSEMDLQDIFQRFTFDTVWKLLFDKDPKSLSLDFPYVEISKAFTDSEEAIFLRHIRPPFLWKLQQILGVGEEKKLSDAWKSIDRFIYSWLAQKLKDYNNSKHEEEGFVFFTAIMQELKDPSVASLDPIEFQRDTFVNLIAAGKDTISSALSWFFYLLAGNRSVEDKILEEIQTHLEVNSRTRWKTKDLDEMIYLHAALCESLRLYPPVPFNPKSPLEPEILPSGHQVDQNTHIILSFYSMGRMKSTWGEDCLEYKPERWISGSGRIKHEPSYKFSTFNAGPRACLGKTMAMSQLKIVSAMIIYHYQVQLVEGHRVLPGASVVLHMKHGLKVRLNRRSELSQN